MTPERRTGVAPDPARIRLAGYVLTRNEAANVARAVDSLSTVCDHVLVVDSESTDDTVAIAEKHGADVVIHPFTGFSAQRILPIGTTSATNHLRFTRSPTRPGYPMSDLERLVAYTLTLNAADRFGPTVASPAQMLGSIVMVDSKSVADTDAFAESHIPNAIAPPCGSIGGQHNIAPITSESAFFWTSTPRLCARHDPHLLRPHLTTTCTRLRAEVPSFLPSISTPRYP